MHANRDQRGFTLIELMVVVAIIGIIASIAIPNLIVAVDRSRQRRTMVDMRNIALAWEARNTEASRYNAAGLSYEGSDQKVDIDSVVAVLAPTYMKVVPKLDGWHNPFVCYTDQQWNTDNRAQRYAIVSAGKDGKFDDDTKEGATTNFDCDIVYANGHFMTYPDGAAKK